MERGEKRFSLRGFVGKNLAPLTSAARLGFAQVCWLADPRAAMMVTSRDDALFALAALHWYQSHACQPLAMHVSMPC